MSPKTLKGFRVLSVQFNKESEVHHEVFIKEHSVRNHSEDKPADRTLFVINVPPYATEISLKRIFACAGRIEKVIFQSKETLNGSEALIKTNGFKVAYIVYQVSDSVQKALNLRKLGPLSTSDQPIVTGMEKWIKEYNAQIYDHNVMEKKVNNFMLTYDKEVKQQKRKENEKDTGGWTVVTKKSRKSTMARKESVKNKILTKSDKNEKRKHLTDFYTFQKRESKMNQLAEMRKKYEEDKKKVNAMKQARKFRPF